MRYRNIFANAERTEEVLTNWANLSDDLLIHEDEGGLLKRLTSRYPEIFGDPVGIELSGNSLRWIAGMRTHLRAVWDVPDQRTKDWYIFKLRDLYAKATARKTAEAFQKLNSDQNLHSFAQTFQRLRDAGMILEPPPLTGPFEDLMYYFQKHSRRALRCANEDCPAPYFFKQDGVRTQRYCSADCSHVGRLQGKLRWWNESGKVNRKTNQLKVRKHGKGR